MPSSRAVPVLVALTATLLQWGCVTTTTHRLPMASGPVGKDAEACEAACRAASLHRQPLSPPPTLEPDTCNPSSSCFASGALALPQLDDPAAYARCLDRCPGATATDGDSCRESSATDIACEETIRPNPGAIAGGTIAVVAVGFLLLVLSGFTTLLDAFDPKR